MPIDDTSSTDQIRWIVTDSEAVMFVVETPKIRLCFSGGGPLGERFTHFFAGVGVQVYEGDGLTETSPTLTSARPGAWKPGTVGRPVAGTSIMIADDGEILAKGPQVFQGYWHNDVANDVATAEAFDERWADHANGSVSRAESIHTFVILARALTIESGELTATLKVRRAVVEQSYADDIDRIYAR